MGIHRAAGLLALVLLAHAPFSAPPLAAQDGGGDAPPPPPPDNRFFAQDMENRLKELAEAADDEARFDALNALSRMTGQDGALAPLADRAFAPVLERALATEHEAFASVASTFLAAVDGARLGKEIAAQAAAEKTGLRVANAATLAAGLGPAEGGRILAGPLAAAATGWPVSLTRVVDALGALRSPEGTSLALAALRHEDPEVRNVAAMALGRIGDAKAIPALVAGLGDSKGSHGWFCAEALGMIEDPALFDLLLGRNASGDALARKAKALEMSARARNYDALLGLVQKGSGPELRTAAANALGRLSGPGDGARSAGAPTPEQRSAAAEALVEVIAADGEPAVRGAAFWALRKCVVPDLGDRIAKRLGVKGDDRLMYFVILLGEVRHVPSAPMLLQALFSDKRLMLRRAASLAFWAINDGPSLKKFEERMLGSSDRDTIQRGCEALGSWKDRRGFELALRLLRTTRRGSADQFQVELALEKMTGHFFGPEPGLWEKWFGKNPEFFSPKQARIEREKWREEFDKENKGFRQSKETEKSVQMGLHWLARHQGFDGVVDCVRFSGRCREGGGCDRAAGARTEIAQAGTTGLSVLAFTGAGYSSASGKYREAVRRGLDYLSATQNVYGDYDQPDYLFNRGYARPVALQALAEGYSTGREERHLVAAERIVARELSLMNERGGWRYSLRREVPEVDSSVTAWVLFAAKTAEKSGIAIPHLLFEGVYQSFDLLSERVPQNGPREEWIDIDPAYGYEVGRDATYLFQTGYQDTSGGPSRATTPLGLMSRIFLGWRRSHPFCIGSANYIVKYYLTDFDVFGEPGKEDWSKIGRFTPRGQWVMYSYYYCTLALHQMGGRFFRDWNRRIGRILPQFQRREGCDRGAFDGWNTDRVYGRVYATGMGVLTLETYYRYLPVLQD